MTIENKKPRGWNFKAGAKDVPNADELRKRGQLGGKIGGKARVPKGFSNPEVLAKAQRVRGIKPKKSE